MSHELVLPECRGKFEEIDKHIEESLLMRDLIVRHETKIKVICTDIDDLKKWIFGSSAAVILTIFLATLALAVTWGRTLEKVERLDRISQQKDING
jgi:hypothetical protein